MVDLIGGRMGQPPGGFPPEVQKRILRDRKPLDGPARRQPAAGRFRRGAARSSQRCSAASRPAATSCRTCCIPRCSRTSSAHAGNYSDTSVLPTPVFFYGQEPGEEIAVDIEPGKTLIIKFLTVGEPHADGTRTVFFELNGQPRDVTRRRSVAARPRRSPRAKADPTDPQAGRRPHARPGRHRRRASRATRSPKGQKLLTLEAMKMETTVHAEVDGHVAEVLVKPGSQVETGDLLLRLEN